MIINVIYIYTVDLTISIHLTDIPSMKYNQNQRFTFNNKQ